jgi:hypothetical protein
MIISQITGGLGNQMFQYAFGKYMSMQWNVPLYLDVESYKWDNLREFELASVFKIDEGFASKDLNEQCIDLHTYPLIARIIRKLTNGVLPYYIMPHVKEKSFEFDELLLKVRKNTLLSGHFQSERYFKPIEPAIRNAFQFRHTPNPYYQTILSSLETLNTVSIHIRRGDYVTDATTNQFHGCCSLAYYKLAIDYVVQKIKQPTFVFVSDDIDWVKSNFKNLPNVVFVENNQGDAYEDMRIMSLCNHNIIANSSFSWWGAWLNTNCNKIVVAPKNWFANAEMQKQTTDLYPSKWIKL